MDTLSEPSEQERRCYYFGLPSSPRLVARSGREPWSLRTDGWSRTIERTLRVIREHAIIEKWNDDSPDSLRCQVVSLVEERGLHWHAIDVLRSGYQDLSDAPVVVFISVEPGTLSWYDGQNVVSQCRFLLERHELHDVQCEIKESRFTYLAAPRVLQLPDDAGTNGYAANMSQISDCVGNVISSIDTPTREGTNCLYLRDRRTDATYALTCRHVCFGAAGPGDSVELLPSTATSHSSASMKKSMIQLGTTTFDETLSLLQETRQKYQDQVRKYEVRASMVHDDRLPGMIQYHQSLIDDMTPVIDELQARVQPSSRTFGQVAYVRGFAIRIYGELSDWSLVRLDQDRFSRPFSELQNRVYVGTGFSTLPGIYLPPPPDADGTCRLGGPLLGIASDPRTASAELYNMPIKDVAKRGGGSGLTFGLYNEAKSVVRTITGANSTQFIALEWCIISHQRGNRMATFSTKGDSGACVWDVSERRIAGMVTGGLGRDEVLRHGNFRLDVAIDVTYSTPIEWIMEDMAACGLELDIL